MLDPGVWQNGSSSISITFTQTDGPSVATGVRLAREAAEGESRFPLVLRMFRICGGRGRLTCLCLHLLLRDSYDELRRFFQSQQMEGCTF